MEDIYIFFVCGWRLYALDRLANISLPGCFVLCKADGNPTFKT